MVTEAEVRPGKADLFTELSDQYLKRYLFLPTRSQGIGEHI